MQGYYSSLSIIFQHIQVCGTNLALIIHHLHEVSYDNRQREAKTMRLLSDSKKKQSSVLLELGAAFTIKAPSLP